jgi:hypothetical protein
VALLPQWLTKMKMPRTAHGRPCAAPIRARHWRPWLQLLLVLVRLFVLVLVLVRLPLPLPQLVLLCILLVRGLLVALRLLLIVMPGKPPWTSRYSATTSAT